MDRMFDSVCEFRFVRCVQFCVEGKLEVGRGGIKVMEFGSRREGNWQILYIKTKEER